MFKQIQQNDPAIRKFQRVVVGCGIVLVDLPEDCDLVVDNVLTPQPQTYAPNFICERQLRAAARPATGHSFGGLTGMSSGAAAPPAGGTLAIAKSDYDAFERLLGDIQAAYSTEDLSALRAKVTPEMLSYFSE